MLRCMHCIGGVLGFDTIMDSHYNQATIRNARTLISNAHIIYRPPFPQILQSNHERRITTQNSACSSPSDTATYYSTPHSRPSPQATTSHSPRTQDSPYYCSLPPQTNSHHHQSGSHNCFSFPPSPSAPTDCRYTACPSRRARSQLRQRDCCPTGELSAHIVVV